VLRIGIIGAGIGGLSAALALRQAGFQVDVYEQAAELTEIGGGINMAPNAVRVLRRVGLGPGLDRDGVRPLLTHQRRWQDGRTLQQAPLNPLCEQLYGAPHMTIHRRDLLAVIASGMPSERIHLGHRLAGLTDQGDSVAAWFDNGVRIKVDMLVGADGIHSAVRTRLFGDEAPVFAGCVAYRGLVPVERIADLGLDHSNQSWVGPGAHFVHYFVSRGGLLNFVGWTEHDTWNREDWTDHATIDRALAAFAGWHPQIGRIIGAAETCFVWALFDIARRCVPSDVSVHRPGCGAGDRGRRRARCLSRRLRQRSCRRPSALRANSHSARQPVAGDVARQQVALPYGGWSGATGTRRRMVTRRRPRARHPALAVWSRPGRASSVGGMSHTSCPIP
jgi:2-polyprenyl-6-methoxyphenol hydroxylase-like FAD-dependent oxidoreductase